MCGRVESTESAGILFWSKMQLIKILCFATMDFEVLKGDEIHL